MKLWFKFKFKIQELPEISNKKFSGNGICSRQCEIIILSKVSLEYGIFFPSYFCIFILGLFEYSLIAKSDVSII